MGDDVDPAPCPTAPTNVDDDEDDGVSAVVVTTSTLVLSAAED